MRVPEAENCTSGVLAVLLSATFTLFYPMPATSLSCLNKEPTSISYSKQGGLEGENTSGRVGGIT